MARGESKARKTSLYRLKKKRNLSSLIQSKYLDRDVFESKEVVIADTKGLLVWGEIRTDHPKWLTHLGGLAGHTPEVSNVTSAAVLLLPVNDHVYGLSWGFGHIIIDPAQIDSSFGLRFAIRRANPDQLNSLTVHTFDSSSRVSQQTVPGGADLGDFDIEDFGETIGKLVGPISAENLSGDKENGGGVLKVRGTDGLTVPLAKSASDLISDLKEIDRVVEHDEPVERLRVFENTRPLRPGSPVAAELNKILSASLAPGADRLALSWPRDRDEQFGEASSYKITGLGRADNFEVDDLELSDLISLVEEVPEDDRLAQLRKINVQALSAEDTPLSRAIPADKWITFETDYSDARYVYHHGRWFNIGTAYLDGLRDRVSSILAKKASFSLPTWPREEKENGSFGPISEGDYNKLVAQKNVGFLCLDRKLLYTKQHPRGIEACDIIDPDNRLIHVKRLDGSVAASHLFNQALVSTEALMHDPEALQELNKQIKKIDSTRVLDANFRPREVVLAFAGKKADPKSLFTFSQVSLLKLARNLPPAVELMFLDVVDDDATSST